MEPVRKKEEEKTPDNFKLPEPVYGIALEVDENI